MRMKMSISFETRMESGLAEVDALISGPIVGEREARMTPAMVGENQSEKM